MRSTIAALALALLACSSPAVCGCGDAGDDAPAGELPNAFRVEAEIVSVEPTAGIVEGACDPHTRDAAGPDWTVDFRGVDTGTPTFRVVSGGHDQSICRTDDHSDCCELIEGTAGGWRITCHGDKSEVVPGVTRTFVFEIAEGGAGTATSTSTGPSGSCVSRVEWSAIAAL